MEPITEIVAIDGPAGAGKSTVARRVADALGYAFLDTGAMYRASTWWALRQGVNLEDPGALAAATREMPLELRDADNGLQVFVGDHDITKAIRTPEVTREIYRLDQVPQVREHLVALQRQYGARRPTVAEGRDMGTVVFPAAKCKVFLDASLDERSRRRLAELQARGIAVDFESLRAEIHERDEKTRSRAVAPLRRAADAILVDTTHMTIDQAVETIAALAHAALNAKNN